MKYTLFVFLFFTKIAYAQKSNCENIFIITTDGFRWQELFSGADSTILFNTKFVRDTSLLKFMYWANTPEERRKKLMPFLWNYVAANGQLWGNRNYENLVSVANPYRFSYAGYNEIFTGFPDRSIIANKPKDNPNTNVLGWLSSLPEYHDKVAMFGSWKLFSYILNGTQNKIPMNAGYQLLEDDTLTATDQVVNYIQQTDELNSLPVRSDLLTFSIATSYIKKKHPRVVHIGFGETDEFAHHGEYDNYLNQANLFDKFLSEIWTMIQRDEFYKNKTTLFITTDHGRGRKPGKWTVHGPVTSGSEETWMVQLGPNIPALGEVKEKADLNNEQFAQTIAAYLGKVFVAAHPIAEAPYSLIRQMHRN